MVQLMTPERPDRPPPEKPAAVREVPLEELLRGDRELLIRHGEQVYRLRLTRNGRLLLTK
jgi:hemin uptake protein HemP